MILRRLGNKSKIAANIISQFPYHNMYVDMFFGAGGMFFNKNKVKYNIVNDIDDDVYNLFMVLIDNYQELYDFIELMPVSESLFNFWKNNTEIVPIRKAARFLMLSNFSYLGEMETMRFGHDNTKNILLNNFQETFKLIKDVMFLHTDFRNVLDKISFGDINNRDNVFIYADPPYLNTRDNYQSSFSEADFDDLMKILIDSKINFAISEFNNDYVVEKAKMNNLNIIIIGERRTLGNRTTEILITNFKNNTLF